MQQKEENDDEPHLLVQNASTNELRDFRQKIFLIGEK